MSSTAKQPVLFLSHGGGPSFFMSSEDTGGGNSPNAESIRKRSKNFLQGMDKKSPAADYLRCMAKKENLESCKAILVVSAHWEEKTVTVQTTPNPNLYYDYYNFPPETYQLTWQAKGAPELAQKTQTLLEAKGIKSTTDDKRGYDHGVFVPLLLVYPKPSIPVFQVSLDTSLDTEKHLALGEALAPLREEGVLIIGSGFTTHRMGGPDPAGYGKIFQNWLHDILKNPALTPEERRQLLASCDREQKVRDAHPRIEHFLPFLVAMAASEYSLGKVLFSDTVMSSEALLEHYRFD